MKTRFLPPTREGIADAVEILQSGELVALPTETVYGLAGNAFEPEAVLRIFSAKERPSFDPLIVHLASRHLTAGKNPEEPDPLATLADEGILDPGISQWPHAPRILALMSAFWPGPLTLLLPKGRAIPDLVTSGLPTVGVRMPANPIFQAVLEKLRFPLAAPSANRFGRISPTCARHVEEELEGRIAAILDGGDCPVGVESTILSIDREGHARILRPGKISASELQGVWGAPVESAEDPKGKTPSRPRSGQASAPGSLRDSVEKQKEEQAEIPSLTRSAVLAPGMIDQHYAPRKPLYLLSEPLISAEQLSKALERSGFPTSIGLLTQGPLAFEPGLAMHEPLSGNGDPIEAARNLFSTLRRLDGHPAVSHLIADLPPPPREGLSAAIADRLNRASINKPLLTP